MESSINGGTPIAGWFLKEGPLENGWWTGNKGSPILGNLHIDPCGSSRTFSGSVGVWIWGLSSFSESVWISAMPWKMIQIPKSPRDPFHCCSNYTSSSYVRGPLGYLMFACFICWDSTLPSARISNAAIFFSANAPSSVEHQMRSASVKKWTNLQSLMEWPLMQWQRKILEIQTRAMPGHCPHHEASGKDPLERERNQWHHMAPQMHPIQALNGQMVKTKNKCSFSFPGNWWYRPFFSTYCLFVFENALVFLGFLPFLR